MNSSSTLAAPDTPGESRDAVPPLAAESQPFSSSFSSPFSSQRSATLPIALLLVLATLAVYEPSLHNAFVDYDDPTYITANPHVMAGLSPQNITWAFTAVVAGHWQPLTVISHMVDVQLWGLKPAGHHFDSLALHALNVVLLFLLLREATGFLLRSALAAALFALFPLNVEAVAWAADRKALLCTFFLLLALLAYLRYVRKPSVGRYLAIVLCFALGLMSEAMVITLPFVLLLMDYWPLQRISGGTQKSPTPGTHPATPWSRLIVEKIPLALMSIGSSAATLYAARRGGAVATLTGLSMSIRIKNAIYSYAFYLAKAIWPVHLAAFYPHPGHTLAISKVIAAGAVLAGISVAVWRFRQRRYLVFGWLWFLATMLPVSGLAQAGLQGMADRYGYIPFIGIFVAVVWLLAETRLRIKLPLAVAAGLACAVLAAYGSVSRAQVGYWRDTLTLFSHAAAVTSRNGVAEDNIGQVLNDMGRHDLALDHFERAAEYMPQWCTPHFHLALALQAAKRLDEAVREYQTALDYETDADEAWQAHNNLGAIDMQMHRLPQALAELNAALSINPGSGLSLMNRGLIEYTQHNLEPARADLFQSVAIAPNPQSYFWLGRVLEDQGKLPAAAEAYAWALRLAPGSSEIQSRLDALQRKGSSSPESGAVRALCPAGPPEGSAAGPHTLTIGTTSHYNNFDRFLTVHYCTAARELPGLEWREDFEGLEAPLLCTLPAHLHNRNFCRSLL